RRPGCTGPSTSAEGRSRSAARAGARRVVRRASCVVRAGAIVTRTRGGHGELVANITPSPAPACATLALQHTTRTSSYGGNQRCRRRGSFLAAIPGVLRGRYKNQ